MVEKNVRGDVRTKADPLAIKTKGLRTTYEREIVTAVTTEVQIGETSWQLESPPEESLTEWTEEGRGKVRLRSDPLALLTRGVKTTYEQRNKGGLIVNLENKGNIIKLETEPITVNMEK